MFLVKKVHYIKVISLFENQHMAHPIEILNKWLQEERELGATNPFQAVLSTATLKAVPHARVVAIREISEHGLLFFTQKGTKKVVELSTNPNAVITFWLELVQREVILEGNVVLLSDSENEFYWQNYPREAKIRFYSYAPTSSLPIESKQILEAKKKQIEEEYSGKELPVSPFYCGFRFNPTKVIFYTYRTDGLSDVIEYTLNNALWTKQFLSP